jgi:hypothetical protein
MIERYTHFQRARKAAVTAGADARVAGTSVRNLIKFRRQ